MKKAFIAFGGAIFFLTTGLFAEEETILSLKGNDPEFTRIFRGGVKEKTVNEEGLIVKANGPVYSYNTVPEIDPKAAYELVIKVKYNGNKKGISFGGGFITNVASPQVFCYPNTLTELASDFSRGDNELIVKDASTWKTGNYLVAFEAKEDASDLPNTKLTRPGIAKVEKKPNGTWLVELKSPEMKVDAKKGSKVRVHYQSNTWNTIDTKWIAKGIVTEYRGIFTGIANPYPQPRMFWPGTKKFGVVFFTSGLDKGESLTISELSLKKITE